jgi:predicted transposase/invertase (TIGR01784 family)
MEKLIRFDWAIKKLLRNKTNFDILEGFLTALLHEEIIVVNLLESESNQEDETDKFNRVDLLVENSRSELIIIEVQVKSEHDFFHRITYGSAKLLSEHFSKGQSYQNIKKIISVSITYFNLGAGSDYLYYGSTNFVGMHTNDTLTMTDAQHEQFGIRDVCKIFPEHYLIRVATFPDQINEALDEWIYMLKHSEVRPEFTAKHIQDASTRLQVMNLDPEQRRAYERYMENVSYQESMLWSSRIEEKIAIAKKLLAHGVTADIIRASTGLSAQELDRLRKTVRQQAC